MKDERRPRATMADLAAAAGVSPMTVSNCFKHPHKVQVATRKKVLETAAALGYVPNLIASSLASGNSRMIAALVPSLRNSNYARTLKGLGDHLHNRGYELLLAEADDPVREEKVLRGLLGRRPAGIVMTGGEHSQLSIELIRQSGVPVVETWRHAEPSVDMAVGFSLFDAARDIANMMVRKGLRHIGWAGHDEPSSERYVQRQLGFQQAMNDAGLRADLVFLAPESSGFAGGRLAMEALLRQEPRLQGLCCVTDVMAAGALFECMRRGWSVPERFSVAGYGDYEIAAEVPPGLTTVKTNGAEIGRAAAEMLLQKIETGHVESTVRQIPYEIVIRHSL
ncbi:MAG: LacI family DNA-binding transcriptional regulator [Burkholderiaceae bacterium]|nr:LacI family DNA-binding transcriptional regulator [Burkholderiaceae bacterium]